LPEVVGQTGLLIDPHDHAALAAALKQALTDSAFRERSALAGIARAKTFTWQQTAAIVLATYQMVLSR
jgi:alpha-1,3-rhamnosyl/mannosyltransferase